MSQPELFARAEGRAAQAARLFAHLVNAVRIGLWSRESTSDIPTEIWVEITGTMTDFAGSLAHDAPVPEIVDIVVADGGGLDLSFHIPTGPLKDVARMIESEILYRSPFVEGAFRSFWVARETPDGEWRVEATLILRARMEAAEDQIAKIGARVGRLRRIGSAAHYATKADGARQTGGWLNALFRLPSGLRNGIFGTAILLVSATALTVTSHLNRAGIQSDAMSARSAISAQSALIAEQRALDLRRTQSRDRLALVGILSQHLPDSVWLDQLVIEGDEVALVGYGPSATDVQRVLAGLPFLADVHLSAPVTRDNSQSLERFRLAAILQGPVTAEVGPSDE